MQRLALILAAALLAPLHAAQAFDLQGHRGARGLAPENTIAGFAKALAIGVHTLETDIAINRDGVLLISHDPSLNPDITRGPDGQFLAARGPVIFHTPWAELQRYDVGRLRPGTRYAGQYPDQQPVDGARLPALMDRIDSTVAKLDSTAGNANALIAENRPAINSFANDGLAQLGPTLAELRRLIRDLRNLSDRLEDRPASYILGRDAPKEFEPK